MNDINVIKKVILEATLASQQAKAMGLRYMGFGRYGDGHRMYKSDGTNLVPMQHADKKKTVKEGFLAKFIRLCNKNAETHKNSSVLLHYMISLLPNKETGGEKYANKETLENVLNNALPSFNLYVKKALSMKSFRVKLLKTYLDGFNEKDSIQSADPIPTFMNGKTVAPSNSM